MAYSAIPEGNNYAVYNNGQRVSTTSAAGLVGFGLSPSINQNIDPGISIPYGTIETTPTQPYNYSTGAYDTNPGTVIPPPPPIEAGTKASKSGTIPKFHGDLALIQITSYPGTYLLDTKAKTIRAFSSDRALMNAIPNVDARQIVEVPASYVSPGGMFSVDTGYDFLENKYAIQEDGKFLSLDASASQLQARYGQAINQNAEQDAYLLLDGIMSSIRDNPNGGLPGAFIDAVKNDKSALAFIISSLAYGGYTPGDAYSDMKRRYLISQGNTDLQNINPISPTMERGKYQATDAGKQALSNPSLTPPNQIGTLDPSVMKLPLFQIPQEAFNTLIPIMNPDTQEYKDAVSKIQDAYHDVLLQQLSATTEQAKAIADANWNTFRENTQSQLGIQLSNNALDAWTQIQNAYGTFAQQGISGSGLEAESIDDYLKRVRSQANQLRSTSQTQSNSQEAIYYQKYATPQQVKDLIATDPVKAQGYGLVPSAEIKNALSYQTLKAKYPNLSDQEINDYIASTLDENGNYRSSIYQTYMTSKLQTLQDEQKYKEGMVQNNSLLDEAKAYRQFTMPDSPFLRDVSDPTKVGAGMAAPTISDLGGNIMGTPANYSSIQGVIGGSYNSPVSTGTPPAPNVPAVTPPVSSPQTQNPYFPQPQPPQAQTNPVNPTSSYSGLSVLSKAYPSVTPQQFNTPLQPMGSTSGSSNAFSIPALKPSSSPGYAPAAVSPVTPLSSFPAAKPSFGSLGNSMQTTTPSTTGSASVSKTLSALQSGLNNIKNFGSNVAGGFKSLFGY